MTWDDHLDALVIGGGLAGLIFLKYATDKKLKVQLVEKEEELGGLWNRLPEWQDIQIRPEDWSINDLPIKGVDQKNVLANIRSWATKYRLTDKISTSTEVKKVVWNQTHWTVLTNRGEITTKNLVAATGLHNSLYIPEISKNNSQVMEFHSSQLFDKSLLKAKRVAVLGGSASAWDLLDLAIQEKASEVHWVYRSNRWMMPSTKPKYLRSNLRILAFDQFRKEDVEKISSDLQVVLEEKYHYFGLDEIRPKGKFRIDRDILVGGRPLMISHFKDLHRHMGTIDRIDGNSIQVGDEKFDADVLLYGTGYRLNLKYLNLPEFTAIQSQEELAKRCSLRFQSLDYPNLYFFGPTMLDTNTSTPFYLATLAKTAVGAIRRAVRIPTRVYPNHIPHWELIKELACFDHQNYSWFWRLKYKLLSWWYLKHKDLQIKV